MKNRFAQIFGLTVLCGLLAGPAFAQDNAQRRPARTTVQSGRHPRPRQNSQVQRRQNTPPRNQYRNSNPYRGRNYGRQYNPYSYRQHYQNPYRYRPYGYPYGYGYYPYPVYPYRYRSPYYIPRGQPVPYCEPGYWDYDMYGNRYWVPEYCYTAYR